MFGGNNPNEGGGNSNNNPFATSSSGLFSGGGGTTGSGIGGNSGIGDPFGSSSSSSSGRSPLRQPFRGSPRLLGRGNQDSGMSLFGMPPIPTLNQSSSSSPATSTVPSSLSFNAFSSPPPPYAAVSPRPTAPSLFQSDLFSTTKPSSNIFGSAPNAPFQTTTKRDANLFNVGGSSVGSTSTPTVLTSPPPSLNIGSNIFGAPPFKSSTTAALFGHTAPPPPTQAAGIKKSNVFSRLSMAKVPPVFSRPPPPISEQAAAETKKATTQLKISLPLKKKPQPQQQYHHLEETKAAAEEVMAPATNEHELSEMLRRRALTDQDRFDILDARDKLMKARGLHKKNIVLKGTCPDLCPEKERYSRLVKNQLRVYEKLDNDEMNHRATVKEYSRSSADQDVPLSHELRPVGVLKRTMDHILCNVIDRVDSVGESISDWYANLHQSSRGARPSGSSRISENIGDWFEFVWNTTRAIRKDVTQQQLGDVVAAGLVEKCARFHIMCSERLVEEDSNNFSRKLNDENLTKCLQTLKHMYEDLRHEGVRCASEPEFRSYEVLMNLNDGDVLRSILTLDLWVRENPDIVLAVKIFMALNSNNYVRFFKLVREASLMQGCILLRYFYQVRKRALDTIIRANCPPSKNIIPFSLTKLTYLLGFEDVQSCGLHCQLHGLRFDVNQDAVFLSRQSYIDDPEEIPELTRPRNLIESKRAAPWSEAVNGGPLTGQNPYLGYTPHDSFDPSTGYLKPEAHDASDQTGDVEKVPMSPEDRAKHRIVLERQKSVESSIFEIAREILGDVLDAQTEAVVKEAINETRRVSHAGEVMREMLDEEVSTLVKAVAAETMKNARNEELERRLRQEMKADAAQEVADAFVDEEVDALISALAKEEMKVAERDRKLIAYVDVAKTIVEDLCSNFVCGEVKIVAAEALEGIRLERERRTEQLRRKASLRLMGKVFGRWRSFAAKQRRIGQVLLGFPSCPAGNLSVEEQNKRFGTLIQSKKSSSRERTTRLFRAIDVGDSILQSLLLQPLDLDDLVAPILTEKRSSSSTSHRNGDISWKCLLCLPSVDDDDSQFRPLLEVIRRKFTTAHSKSKVDENLLSCSSNSRNARSNFSFCVRCIDEEVLDEEVAMSEKKRREYLAGTSALIFVHLNDAESSRRRLHKLLSNIYRDPPFPVHVLTTTTDLDDDDLVYDLESFPVVSSVRVSNIPSDIYDVSLLSEIVGAVRSVAERSLLSLLASPPVGLQVRSSVREMVEEFICVHVLAEFYTNLRDRRLKDLPHQRPSTLVALFNAALAHMEKMCLNPDLREISWPIPELQRSDDDLVSRPPSYWNDSSYLDKVVESLRSLKLPDLTAEENKGGEEDEDWSLQVKKVNSYFDRIRKSYGDSSQCVTRVRRCLAKTRRKKRNIENRTSLPWTDVIHAFIDYKISLMPTVDPFSASSKGTMSVAFYQADFDRFVPPKTWRASLGWVPECRQAKRRSALEQKNKDKENEKESPIKRIRQELDDSLAFEERLCQALKDNHDDDDSRREDKEGEEMQTSFNSSCHVPAISLLSPSLSIMAAANRRSMMRVDVSCPSLQSSRRVMEDDDNNSSWLESAIKKKRRRTREEEEERALSSSSLEVLKGRIERDLDESMDFEYRLRQALGK